jgi:hypothetical protein
MMSCKRCTPDVSVSLNCRWGPVWQLATTIITMAGDDIGILPVRLTGGLVGTRTLRDAQSSDRSGYQRADRCHRIRYAMGAYNGIGLMASLLPFQLSCPTGLNDSFFVRVGTD